MVAIAVDFPHQQRRSAQPKNPRRFISRAVRQRNERVGRPNWQPTHSFKKFGIPRTTAKAAAIREELAPEEAVGPEVFWANPHEPVSEYEAERASDEQVVIAQRHDEILSGIEEELHQKIESVFNQRKRERLQAFIAGLKNDLAVAMVVAGSIDIDGDHSIVDEEISHLRRSLRRAELDLELLESDVELLSPYAAAA